MFYDKAPFERSYNNYVNATATNSTQSFYDVKEHQFNKDTIELSKRNNFEVANYKRKSIEAIEALKNAETEITNLK